MLYNYFFDLLVKTNDVLLSASNIYWNITHEAVLGMAENHSWIIKFLFTSSREESFETSFYSFNYTKLVCKCILTASGCKRVEDMFRVEDTCLTTNPIFILLYTKLNTQKKIANRKFGFVQKQFLLHSIFKKTNWVYRIS